MAFQFAFQICIYFLEKKMWSLIAIASLAYSADVCRKYACSTEESTDCLDYDDKTEVWTDHPCPSGKFCPDFTDALLFLKKDIICLPGEAKVEVSLECAKYSKEGDECKLSAECDPSLWCKPTTTGLKCQKKTPSGADCLVSSECAQGNVCNNGKCSLYFTVPAGKPATHALACESGILKDKECQPASKSKVPLPAPCKVDDDCVSTSGEKGKCECALNSTGQKYCSLFASDQPNLDAKASVHDGFRYQSMVKMERVSQWPVLEDYGKCLEDNHLGLIKYAKLKEAAEKCGAGWLLISALMVFLIQLV